MTAKERDELLIRVDERLDTLITDYGETKKTVKELKSWKDGLFGGWKVILIISGSAGLISSVIFKLLTN